MGLKKIEEEILLMSKYFTWKSTFSVIDFGEINIKLLMRDYLEVGSER